MICFNHPITQVFFSSWSSNLNLIPWLSQNQETPCYFDKNWSCIITYIKRLITWQRDSHETKIRKSRNHLAISLVLQVSFFMAQIEEMWMENTNHCMNTRRPNNLHFEKCFFLFVVLLRHITNFHTQHWYSYSTYFPIA